MLNTTDRDRGECAAVVQEPHHCAARVEPHAAKPPILQDWQRWQVERARKSAA